VLWRGSRFGPVRIQAVFQNPVRSSPIPFGRFQKLPWWGGKFTYPALCARKKNHRTHRKLNENHIPRVQLIFRAEGMNAMGVSFRCRLGTFHMYIPELHRSGRRE
jgi:hypothetical protein